MKFITIMLAAMLFTTATQAKDMCYTMAEAEAEQGIRIHSELMVIGLNCQHMWPQKNGQNLFQQYRIFTADHANLFTSYDSTLLRFYTKSGLTGKQAEKKLNGIRTAVANRISNDAAKMRPDLFCKSYAPRIEKASNMSEAKIRKWAQTFFESHPVSQPLCNQSLTTGAPANKKITRKKYLTGQ